MTINLASGEIIWNGRPWSAARLERMLDDATSNWVYDEDSLPSDQDIRQFILGFSGNQRSADALIEGLGWSNIKRMVRDNFRSAQKDKEDQARGFSSHHKRPVMDISYYSEMKQLLGITIFRTGTFTDSSGNKRTFGKDDIQQLLKSFEQGIPGDVPVILGHVSEEFAQKVADDLGIPSSVLQGEGIFGKGAARLGRVTGLHANGVLSADLELHPKVAALVEQGFFTGNSPEIEVDREETKPDDGSKVTVPLALSALSLLGKQRPAIGDNPPLQAGTMLSEGRSFITLEESLVASVSSFEEGTIFAPPGQASAGESGEVEWIVPIKDLGSGTFVQASVSAASEATAKRTALRVVENFLFNVTGPLGKIIGGTLGVLLARKLVVGRTKKGSRGVPGRISWRLSELEDNGPWEVVDFAFVPYGGDMTSDFEKVQIGGRNRDLNGLRREIALVIETHGDESFEPFPRGDADIKRLLEGTFNPEEAKQIIDAIGMTQLRQWAKESNDKWLRRNNTMADDTALQAPEGVSEEAWAACLAKAKSEGNENPEAHCRQQMSQSNNSGDNAGAAIALKAVATALGLSEWATAEEMALAVSKLQQGTTKLAEHERTIESLETRMLMSEFTTKVSAFETIPGKPEDLAKKLLETHRKFGEEESQRLFDTWQVEESRARSLGLTKVTLSQRGGDDVPEDEMSFMELVNKEFHDRKDADETRPDVIKRLMKSKPDQYAEYSRENTVNVRA